MELRTIAVAIDFSAPSATALRWAEHLAKEACATVRSLHVVDTLRDPDSAATVAKQRRPLFRMGSANFRTGDQRSEDERCTSAYW